MLKKISTDTINWIVIIGVVLLIIEIAFFEGGAIGSAIFFGVLLFIGWKNYSTMWGKAIFWIGLIGLIFSIFNMIAVRFLIIAFLVLLLIDYTKSKQNPIHIDPTIYLDDNSEEKEPIIRLHPLFRQMIYGDETTSNTAFEWNDINIHGGIGDRFIDLSNTVLPNDTAVVSIRHFVGNIVIYVPYEVEIMVHHSAIFGRAYILNKYHPQLVNQVLSYKTENYDNAYPRIKIITSIISGDIEVRRI